MKVNRCGLTNRWEVIDRMAMTAAHNAAIGPAPRRSEARHRSTAVIINASGLIRMSPVTPAERYTHQKKTCASHSCATYGAPARVNEYSSRCGIPPCSRINRPVVRCSQISLLVSGWIPTETARPARQVRAAKEKARDGRIEA